MKVTRARFLRNTAVGLLTAGVLAACGGGGGGGDADTWTVGTEPGFPPFESMNNGEFEGFDIDLMNAIGEKAGKTIEFSSLPFDSLIAALQGGSIDAAISGMTITPERQEAVDFSDPYFEAGLAIAVAESNTDVKTIDDLKGKRIAVQLGTTGASTADSVEGAQVTTFESAPLALTELSNGNVDAVINDAPATKEAVDGGNIPGVKIVGEVLTDESYGIALPKGSDNLAAVNSAIAELKADGTYDTIYQKWFDMAPPAAE
ncbi:MAG: basic amino acid ABC transporter substrate-binding protein [Phormidesmis sp.]